MDNIHIAYIILGSNIDPYVNLPKGLVYIHNHFIVIDQTPIFKTEPLGESISSHYFHNAAIAIETQLSPYELKHDLLRPIESKLGRIRTSNPNSDRAFDADIVLFDELHQPNDDVPIPDPNLFQYPFISYLLSLLTPSYIIPGDGRTLQQLSNELNPTETPYEQVGQNLNAHHPLATGMPA